MLERLGAARPAVSIVALVDGPVGAEIEALAQVAGGHAGFRQLILARCAGTDPVICPDARLAQATEEGLVEFANRTSMQATGHLLVVVPPGSGAVVISPDCFEDFAAETWLGLVLLDDNAGRAPAFIIRGNLWLALGGFEISYRDWTWALRDLCLRARAIGYAAPDWPPEPGDDMTADARLFAQRASRALDCSTRAPIVAPAPGRFTVYTAITNCYDSLKPQPAAALTGCELLAFLDRETAEANAGASRGWTIADGGWGSDVARLSDPQRAARFPKINAHLVLPASDYSLWVDASIGIACPFPLPRLAELFLGECDLCVFAHYARQSVYEEAEACLAYGLDRPEIIEAQIARYHGEGLPVTTGLIEAPVILRRHSKVTRALNEAWWAEIHKGSRRDQLSFNYVAWKLGFRYALFPLSLAVRNGLFVKFMR